MKKIKKMHTLLKLLGTVRLEERTCSFNVKCDYSVTAYCNRTVLPKYSFLAPISESELPV